MHIEHIQFYPLIGQVIMSIGSSLQTPLLRLSDDLLLMIFEFLYCVSKDFIVYGNKQDLLACRATCQRLRDVGQSDAFAYIEFTHSREGYERLLAISKSSHLCSAVRHVTCYFERCDKSLERAAETHDLNQAEGPSDDVYETHGLSNQQQEFLAGSSVDVASLATAFNCFRKLRTVRILQDLRNTFGDWFLLDRVFANSRAGQALFEALTSTLFVTGLGIERLALGSFHGDSPALIGIIQGLDLAKQGLYQKAFRNLKCLEILLPMVVHHEDNGFLQTLELNHAGISVFIQSAPLLEELRLVFDISSQHALPSSFVDSLQIPNLHTLRLAAVLFQDPSCLVRFCSRHSATLKMVEFSELCLQTGSWETVYIGLRDILMLESVILPGPLFVGGSLIEEFAEQERADPLLWAYLAGDGCRVINNDGIERFIQRRTKNNPST